MENKISNLKIEYEEYEKMTDYEKFKNYNTINSKVQQYLLELDEMKNETENMDITTTQNNTSNASNTNNTNNIDDLLHNFVQHNVNNENIEGMIETYKKITINIKNINKIIENNEIDIEYI